MSALPEFKEVTVTVVSAAELDKSDEKYKA
jgi:hypothetical protein